VCDQPGLAHHVEDRLRKLDSPITIAVELGRGVWGPQGTVSHATIDRAAYVHGNTMPRRVLGWSSAQDAYDHALALIA
jgi:IS30 family transposase